MRTRKLLKANMLTIVNFALLCSYPLGMTCRSANPMRKHRAGKM